MDDDEGGPLAPIERFVRRHLKALDEFVRHHYPSVVAEPFVHAVFDRVQHRIPVGSDVEVRMQLFGEARALIRRQNRDTWPGHNAHVVRERMRDAGNVITDWHAWSDLNQLLACLEQLTPDQQEVLRLITFFGEIGPAELALVLHIGQEAAAVALDDAAAALRAAFGGDNPTAQVDGVER